MSRISAKFVIVLGLICALSSFALTACGDEYISGEYPQFDGLGSADSLSGNTAMVSVFVSDDTTEWDFSSPEDKELADDSLEYLGIATDWISDQASKYGRDATFTYDWSQNPELRYEASIDSDLVEGEDDEPSWDYIYENIDVDAILDDTNSENICFMFFLNTPLDNEMTSCTSRWEESDQIPYEICYIFTQCADEEETPASYAHEILHAFGAPDLYTEDEDGNNYGIDEDYVTYCEENHPNEIMLTTYDISSGEETPCYDVITNDFTDITAYYVGLIDSCPEVDEWGLDHSQYVA